MATYKKEHWIVDWWLESVSLTEQIEPLKQYLEKALQAAGVKILKQYFHQFEPSGITGFFLLAESHLSVHTWPEEKLIALDIFSCKNASSKQIVEQLKQELKPVKEKLYLISRGEK